MKKHIFNFTLIALFMLVSFSFSKGLKAKDFALKDENGNIVNLSDLKDKVSVLVFWATTCGSCKVELPEISVLQGEYSDKPVVFYAIVIDTKNVKKAQKKKELWGFDIPILIGDSKVVSDYRIFGTPIVYVLRKDLTIAKILIGRKPIEKLQKAIDKALEE